MLDHGLYGEYVYLSPHQKEPNPYVVRSGEKCYHAFRWDLHTEVMSQVAGGFTLGLTKISVMRKPTSLNFFVPFMGTPSTTIRLPSDRYCPTVAECLPSPMSLQRLEPLVW